MSEPTPTKTASAPETRKLDEHDLAFLAATAAPATHDDKLAAALRDMLADSRSLEIRHYAETMLADYDASKGGAQ